jgi:hypothetical protein
MNKVMARVFYGIPIIYSLKTDFFKNFGYIKDGKR